MAGDGIARPAEGEPFIRVENLTKAYGDVTAIDDLSLDIHAGEIFALLGGSGCGKTTLLRVMAGLEPTTSGRIFIDGDDMTAIPPHRRPTNMMFQSYALFPHMRVEQNIAFGLRQERLPTEEIDRRVAEALELVQLSELAGRRPHQLSGGQMQRVALARCLVKRPKVLLLDEPMASLDKNLREQTQFELARIQDQVGITFVLVTHDQHEAMALASRIGVMEAGRIRQVGTAEEVYEFPASRFVAGFLGSVNLFDGRVVETGADRMVVESDEAGCRIILERRDLRIDQDLVWIALRPEKLQLAPSAEVKDGANTTFGVIEDVGYLGASAAYQVRLGSGKLVHATRPILDRAEGRRFSCGDEVAVIWSPAAAVALTE